MKRTIGFPLVILISSGSMTGCGEDTVSNAYSNTEECTNAGNDRGDIKADWSPKNRTNKKIANRNIRQYIK